MYEFEGKDFSTAPTSKKTQILDWIAPSRREKKIAGYSVDDYYRNQMQSASKSSVSEPRQPRAPKQVHLADHQFFPPELAVLQHKELLAFWRETNYKVPEIGFCCNNFMFTGVWE